jgi:hypothetical protein
MAGHSGILDRQGREASVRSAIGADGTSLAGAGSLEAALEKRHSIRDAKIVFLIFASLFNASVWWGVGILILGSAWATPLLIPGVVICLLTFIALALCADGN